jgi:hypothetical protein
MFRAKNPRNYANDWTSYLGSASRLFTMAQLKPGCFQDVGEY